MRQPPRAAIAVPVGGVLLAAAPRPAEAVAALQATGGDPAAPLVAAAALLAWLLVSWLLLVCAATLGERLPGLAGRTAAAAGRRIAPSVVRRTVALTLGLTVAAGTGLATGGTAWANASAPGAARSSASLDWPGAAAPPRLDWAAPAPAAPTVVPAAPVTPTSEAVEAVVVAPGDSLWAIAAEHLALGADDTQIARAWPSWWAANRDVIGPDPDLLQPGTHLHTPPSATS